MCETTQTNSQGVIEDIYWKKIVNKMYDKDDVHTLTTRFMECVNTRKQSSGAPSMNSSMIPGSNMGSMMMKENKSGQISQNSTIIMPLRPAKLTREDEIKLKKL
jgi:PBP1b-binding outer membrane lipoprotein LpoB